jgi:hypothetical protein
MLPVSPPLQLWMGAQQTSSFAVNPPRPTPLCLPLIWGSRRASRAGWVPAAKFFLAPPPPVSPTATWASVVRGGVCASVEEPACFTPQPAVSTVDFSALYERCLASGLKGRVVYSHATGIQFVTVTCSLPTPSTTVATAGRRRRCHRHRRQCGLAVTTVGVSTDCMPSTVVAAPAIVA